MHEVVKQLLNKIIASTQAYEDTPLFGASNMKIMAESALIGGASGIRACWKEDIRAIRELGDFPIIGLNKVMPEDEKLNDIFITPTFDSAKEVIEAGSDIVALDARITKNRGKEELLELLKKIKDSYPKIPIMADISNLEEAEFVAKSGLVDIIATTLTGVDKKLDAPDLEIIKQIKAITDIPINAEGHIWEKQDVLNVIEAGADMITIGTAISRPHLITERFVKINNAAREKDGKN